MLKKLKELCLTLGVFSLVAVPIAIPATVSASIADQVCSGANAANGEGKLSIDNGGDPSCANSTTSGDQFQSLLTLIVNIFSIVVGFVAVIMIIYGGVKYITSGGDSNNISGAKNTIVYAIIGLVIVALAQVIVHFVLAKAATVTTT